MPVFGVGEHDGLPYYVMQFIQGLGLDEVLEELKQLPAGKPAGSLPCAGGQAANFASRRGTSPAVPWPGRS